jgi:hypothetical protein
MPAIYLFSFFTPLPTILWLLPEVEPEGVNETR